MIVGDADVPVFMSWSSIFSRAASGFPLMAAGGIDANTRGFRIPIVRGHGEQEVFPWFFGNDRTESLQ